VNVARFVLAGSTIGLLLTLAPEVDAFLAIGAATEQFLDVNAAIAMGYVPYPGCVSGQQEGAIGVPYVKEALVKDGVLDPDRPEALLYEMRDGKLFLLGAEYIVDAATWDAHNPLPPTLMGQAFTYNTSPNRFALGPFYALHVWAWRENPKGVYADWNPERSCDGFLGD
jgi:hypothetical protein